MNKLTNIPLCKLAKITDCLHVTPNYDGGTVPMVRVSEVHNDFLSLKTALLVTEDVFQQYTAKHVPQRGDIVLARVGAYLGEFSFVDTIERFCIGQNTTIISPYNHNEYIFYNLISPKTQWRIKQEAAGSAYKSVGVEAISNFELELLEDEAQREEVGRILYNLDRKIALNNAINAELEKVAKLLYDYWFVQFDFPNADGKPYRACGGKMEYNKVLKKEIPKGWKISSINDMTSACRGVSYDKDDVLPNSKDGVLVLRGNNIQDNHLVYDNNKIFVPARFVSEEQQIKKYDIILTMSSGSKQHIGKCTMFQHDSPHTFGAFLSKFTPQKDKRYFVFQSMISDYCTLKIKAICNGTGINNLTNQHFSDILFAVPDSITLKKYEEHMSIIYEQIGKKEIENHELTALRDFLLPLLMNGQVTVQATEKWNGGEAK